MSGHSMHTGGSTIDEGTFAQRARAIGDTLEDVPLRVAAQYYLILTSHLAGDY